MQYSDLEKKILTEVNHTGFPLELRVSKFLTDQDYYVANNVYYVDQDEGKGREIDLRALKNITFENAARTFFVRHCLLIECKKASNKPWVIFTSSNTPYDATAKDITFMGEANIPLWWLEIELEELEALHPFSIKQRRGRSYFEPFKRAESHESIFKALSTTAKATSATRESRFGAGSNSACFYCPLVVLEGQLFEAHLADRDEVVLKQTDSVLISFSYQSAKYEQETFTIPIITETAFPGFISRLDGVLSYLAPLFEHNLQWFTKKSI